MSGWVGLGQKTKGKGTIFGGAFCEQKSILKVFTDKGEGQIPLCSRKGEETSQFGWQKNLL